MTKRGIARVSAVAVVLASALLVSQCQIDKLISPPSGGVLVVNPPLLADSAPLGSSAARVQLVVVGNAASGRLSWTAATARNSPWLKLSAASGTTPDTVPVKLLPATLAVGVYRDTIVVTGTGSSAGELRIPVQFRVQPCGVTSTAVGAPTNGTLGAASCAAPHRAGHPAQVFSVTGSAGDSITLELTTPFPGYLVFDSSLAPTAPSIAESGTCLGVAGNPCLYYQRLPRTGTYTVEVTTTNVNDSGAFSLLLSPPRQPGAADTLAQLLGDSVTVLPTGATTTQPAVVLRAHVSDPDRPDSLLLEVEVKPASVGFTGTGTVLGSPVANGQRAFVRLTSLSDDSSYHWRARAVDQTGRAGPWTPHSAGTDFHVAVPQPPLPPGALGQFRTDSVTAIAVGGAADTTALVLRGTVSDPDPGDQIRLLVEVRPLGTPFSGVATDSGAPVANGAVATALVGGLTDGTSYHWQAWAEDQTGRTSGSLSFGANLESAADFTVHIAHPPATPTALGQFKSNGTTVIAVGGTTNQSTVVFKGTVTDPDAGDSLHLEVEVEPVGTTFTNAANASSGAAVANGGVAQATITNLQDAIGYHWQARTVDQTGRASAPWTSFGGNAESAPDFQVALAVVSLRFTVQPDTAVATVAGVSLTPAVQVTALDINGDTVRSFTDTVTMTIKANPGGSTLGGTTKVVAVAGMATFSNLTLNKVGTGYTLQAALASGLNASSLPFAVAPAAASQLAFTQQPLSAIAGDSIKPAVHVTARDAFGNTATGFNGTVSVAITSGTGTTGAALSGNPPVTAASGVASFAGLTIDKVGTGYTLTASASGTTDAVSAGFDIAPASASRLTFSVQPSTVVAGQAIAPAVQVTAKDSLGNVVTTFTGTVTLAIGNSPTGDSLHGTRSLAASAGVATFNNVTVLEADTGYTLTASAPSAGSTTSASFTVTPGAATLLVFSAEPMTDTAGTPIRPAVQVTALDAHGNVATGFNGAIAVAIGTNPVGGTLSGGTSIPATVGVATFPNLRLNRSGEGYTLTATATGPASATSSSFDVVPAPASRLVFTVAPSNVAAGSLITPAVEVTAEDSLGNVVPSFVGSVAVGIGNNPGTSTLNGTTPKIAVAGVAIFSDLSLNRTGVNYTLTAGAAGLAGATSPNFTVTTGGVTQLVFTAQPATDTAGRPIAPAVQVTAEDGLGNTVTTFVAGVTLSLASNPTGDTLGGTLTVTPINGVASFPNVRLKRAGASYTLAATAVGATPGSSAAFDVIPAPVSALAFATEPATATAGDTIPTVRVAARDSVGNPVTTFTGTVTLALTTNPTADTLKGTLSQLAASGVASFPNLRLKRSGIGYGLTASAATLSNAVSTLFNITPGAAARLAFTVEPVDVSAGASIAPAVQVSAQDTLGNLVPSFTSNVIVAVGTNPTGATLGGTATVAASGGVASFGNLSLNKTGAGFTLAATSAPLTAAASTAFNVTPATGGTVLVFTTQPSTDTAGRAIAPAIVVTAQDGLGNTVPSFVGKVTLGFGINLTGATLAGTDTATAAAGVAILANVRIAKTGTGYTLTASAGGATTGTSGAFDVIPAPVAALAFTVEPVTTAAGAVIAPPVQVTARDSVGNTVPSFVGNVVVAISNNAGGATLSGTLTQPAAAGVAPFPNLSLNKVGTGYTLSAAPTVVGPTAATSSAFDITPATATRLVFSQQPAADTAGRPIRPAILVTAQDTLGNTLTGFTGAVTIGIGTNAGGATLGGTLAVNAAAGVATFDSVVLNRAGTGYTITAAAGGFGTITSTGFNVTPAAASQLVYVVGPSNTQAGATVAPTVRVAALDAFGDTATSFNGAVTLRFNANPGGASLTDSVATAASGIALFPTLSLNKTGTGYALTANAAGLTTATSTLFNITPGLAKSLSFTTEPTNTASGAGITPAPVVTALDSLGNVATAFAGNVTISIGTNPAGGVLGGTATQAAALGVATFPALTIDKAGIGYTLKDSAAGLAGPASAAFNITSGSAGKLAFTTAPPAAAQSGVAFVPQPAVQLEDNSGNPVSTAGVTVTASVATGPGGAAVASPTALTSASGLATFSGLALSGTVGSYTLTFGAPSVTPVTSGTIVLSAGPGAKLAFLTQPSSTAQNAIAFPQQPVVQIQDAAGNAAADSGLLVTAALASGGGALVGTDTVRTKTPGQALFADLGLVGTVGARTIQFTAPGLTAVTSGTVTLTAGSAKQIAIAGGNNQAATAGTKVGTLPSVLITDTSGNPVSGAGVTFSTLAGNGTVSPATPVLTNGSGIAQPDSFRLGNTAKVDTLTATAAGLAGSPLLFTDTAKVGAAATMAKFSGDNLSGPVNSTLGTAHVVLITDANGNPVPGVTVNWTKLDGGSVGPSSSTTSAAGHDSAFSTLGSLAGAQRTLASAVINAVIVTDTFTVTATSGGATQLIADSGSGQTAQVGVAVTNQLVARALDASSNPVPNVTINWLVISGGGNVSAPSSVTDVNGRARVTWTLGTTAGVQTVQASGPGSPKTFSATATPGPVSASQSSVSAAPGSIAASNGSVQATVTVTARDQFGNPIANQPVVLAMTGTGNTVGLAPNTDASGVTTGTVSSTKAEGKTISATINGTPVTQAPPLTVTPATAAGVAFVQGPSDVAAAPSVITPAVTVEVVDAFSNRVTSSTAGIALGIGTNPNGGVLAGGSATAAAGLASFPSVSLTKAGVGYTLVASSGILTTATSAAFTVTPGAATNIAASSATSQSATVNTAVATPPSVLATDGDGNPVAGVNVTFAVATGGGSVNPPTAVATGTNGIATLTSWTLGIVAGANSVTATAAGLAGSPVTFSATGTAGAAAKMSISAGDGQSATAGTAVSTLPTVLVTDVNNNPVSGVAVTFAVAAGGGSLTGTNPATTGVNGLASIGSWTLGTTVGANSLTATATGFAGGGNPVTFGATGTVGAAAKISVSAGNGQSATVGNAVATAPAVLVTDANDNPVSGVTVTFAVVTGGGSLTGTNPVTTGVNGVATIGSWILGTTVEANSLTATATGFAGGGNPVTFTATGTVGAAAKISVSAGSGQTAAVGTAVTTAPAVLVTDVDNNPVSGVTVTFAVATGGGSLTGTNPITTGVNGVAAIGSWTLGTAAGSNTLTATATGFAGGGNPVTFTATGTAGTAAKISVTAGDAQSATAGTAVATAPSVLVTDINDNPVSGVTVTFAVATGGGGVTAATPATSSSGIATVGSWTLGTVVGANTMTATATGFAGGGNPVTFTATGTTGAAVKISASAGDGQSATVGTAVATAPSVLVTDINNNPVSGVTVTFAVATGGGGVTAGTPPTNLSGIATLGTWTLGTIAGSNTLTATATGFSGGGNPVTFTATGTPDAATKLVFTVQPSSTVSVATITPSIQVAVHDQFGNLVTSGSPIVVIGFTNNAGSGAIGGTLSRTASVGVATFNDLSVDKVGVGYTFSASSGILTGATSDPFTISVGAPATITIAGGNGQSAIAGAAVATAPSVIVRDGGGNPVSGVTVTFAVLSGGGGLGSAIPTTDGSGIATLGSWTLGTVAGSNSITATATGFSGGGNPVTFTATGTVGPAAKISIVTGDGQSATVNTNVSTAPSVLITDINSNPVPGVVVTFAVATGGGSVGSATPTTDGSGIATLGSWTLGTVAGANSITATASGFSAGGNPATFNATGTAGAATQLVFAAQPTDAAANTNITPAIQVSAEDQFGNVDPTFTGGVTMVIGTDPNLGLSQLNGTTTQNGALGVATFGDLQITLPGTAFTLQASSGGLSPVTSNSFNITP